MASQDPTSNAPSPQARHAQPEFEEITLADIVRVLHKRKLVLVGVVLLALLAGVSVTAFTTPQYEAKATLVPLEHADIIKNWLTSRHAAELVVEDMGTRVTPALFPARWDDRAQSWTGEQPTREEAGRALQGHIGVRLASSGRANDERFLEITVTFADPIVARDVAASLVDTLEVLRPQLEDITRQEAFDRYYDGQNEQEAQRRAEVAAKQKQYWLALDDPVTPRSPVSPKPMLNMALAGVLGVMLGVFSVFFLEWLGQYRAETRELSVPAEERSPHQGAAKARAEGREPQPASARAEAGASNGRATRPSSSQDESGSTGGGGRGGGGRQRKRRPPSVTPGTPDDEAAGGEAGDGGDEDDDGGSEPRTFQPTRRR